MFACACRQNNSSPHSITAAPVVHSILWHNAVLNTVVAIVCPCRAEEAAIIARQKEAEAAGTAARLPSTLHPDTKAPLAKVNGENDAAGGSGSSSVVQYVWDNVLSLATGVGGRISSGGAAGLPPTTPGAGSSVLEAAATRRKALELIEVSRKACACCTCLTISATLYEQCHRYLTASLLQHACCGHPHAIVH